MSVSPDRNENGTSRARRAFPELEEQFLRLDELSFDELIAFAVAISEKINYYNLDDKLDGNWQPFFFQDETVIQALIKNYDIDTFSSTFYRLYNKLQTEFFVREKLVRLRMAVHFLTRQALLVNRWYRELQISNHTTSLINEVSNLIHTKLKDRLHDLMLLETSITFQAQQSIAVDKIYREFDRIWEVPQAIGFYDFSTDTQRKLDEQTENVEKIYHDFYDTFRLLKELSTRYIGQSMSRGNHPPHIALLIAFVKLYRYQQDELNNITPRHLQFYYRDVLRQAPRKARADQVHICFSLPATRQDFLLPAGTQLDAGKDKLGHDLVFCTDHDALLSDASIVQLKTLYLDSNPNVYTATIKPIVTKIFVSDVTEQNEKNRTGVDVQPWPALGENPLHTHAGSAQQNARIGFALASSVLFLQQGERDITVKIDFTPRSFKTLRKMIREVEYNEEINTAAAFYKIFSNAFNFYITCSNGWEEITRAMVSSPLYEDEGSENSLTFSFSLPNEFDPVVNFDETLHARSDFEVNSRWPVLGVLINPDAALYPYAFISDLVVENISINVEVRKFRNLEVANQNGPLNAAQPFLPFGAIPAKGSFLLIGQKEIFFKKLEELTVHIKWQDVPATPYGFTDYYEGYPEEVVNETFQCRLSILNNYQWMPAAEEDQQVIMLFESRDAFGWVPDYRTKEETHLDYIKIKKISMPGVYEDYSGQLTYDNDTRRGFIKLELVSPQMAFGHDAYPLLLSDSIIKKAKDGDAFIPNKPFTPVIQSMSVDYKANINVNFVNYTKDDAEQLDFIHIHPFGQKELSPFLSSETMYIVPRYTHQGALIMAFKDLRPPQTISLFFQLQESGKRPPFRVRPEIRWSYLVNNTWKRISEDRILADTTDSFVRPGIITIELPGDINSEHSIVDTGLYWIKAETMSGTDNISNVLSVYTNAVSATRAVDDEEELEDPYLLALTIKGTKNRVAEVAEVFQPYSSFSGMLKETDKEFYSRVAERLKHKSRAVTAWDYERIVLKEFPLVYKVKCINDPSGPQSGTVKVIVLPDINTNSAIDKSEPRVSFLLLDDIRKCLQSMSSPFVRIDVCNPEYEKIKVICSVVLKTGYKSGVYINKLNELIKEFLTPWMGTGNQMSHSFGEPLNKLNILGYIESIDFVERVTQFSVVLITHPDQDYHLSVFEGEMVDDVIQPSNPWTILTSASSHHIVADSGNMPTDKLDTGIENLVIGSDFIIIDKAMH